MDWVTPQYSHSEVDRAGRVLVSREGGDLSQALQVILPTPTEAVSIAVHHSMSESIGTQYTGAAAEPTSAVVV